MSDIIQADANADDKPEQSPYQLVLSSSEWATLQAALDDPPRPNAALVTLMRHTPPWELPPAPSQGDRIDEDADKDRA